MNESGVVSSIETTPDSFIQTSFWLILESFTNSRSIPKKGVLCIICRDVIEGQKWPSNEWNDNTNNRIPSWSDGMVLEWEII